ncbi:MULTISPECIES: hypothetical protein [Halorussus]|uniref:hypothetical protein n=1 Tax=Halorussus TaxID=1070314 RepID=UPI0020A14639|nr:hypothetical protein [Halorussus vallis]USZ78719.1 hypothetical protein NGM07_24725 [Halorussus vallis]
MTDAENPGRRPVRGDYRFDCADHECGKSWSGVDLARIAQLVAWHWNREHNTDLKHGYEQIDTVERGGHHVHGNEYTVERIPIYLTSFDVMECIGYEDGYAVPSDNERVCDECYHLIPNEEDRVDEENGYLDEWQCAACLAEAEIEHRADENEQLSEWVS